MKNLLSISFAFTSILSLGQTNTFPSSGNVGIGTTSPQASLHILNGAGRIESTGNEVDLQFKTATTSQFWEVGANSNGFYLYDINSSAYRFVVNTNGNLGIGTTSPSNLLTISGTGALGSTFQQKITTGSQTLALGANSTAAEIQSQGAVPLYINYGGNNVIMNATGGAVGIGTASPASKLHISAASRTQALRVYADGNTTNYLSLGQGSGGAVIDPIGTGLLYLGYDQSSNVILGYGGGNVGIGNVGTPSSMLHINSPVERQTFRLYKSGNTSNYLSMFQGTGGAVIDPIGTGKLSLGYDQITDVYVNGKLGIGTTQPDYPLTVNGSVHAKEVRVDLNVPAPDYVFEKDYQLTSLEDIKNYIDQNKHLPEVPSAKELEKDGVQLGEMNMILLKKIEELTLHMLKQQEEIQKVSKKNTELEERILQLTDKNK